MCWFIFGHDWWLTGTGNDEYYQCSKCKKIRRNNTTRQCTVFLNTYNAAINAGISHNEAYSRANQKAEQTL